MARTDHRTVGGFRLLAAAALLTGLTAGAVPAFAGGPEVGDQGTVAMGRGGAFAVRADDLSALYYNPAGLARLRGTRFYYSHRVTYGEAEYRRARTLDWSEATHGVPRLVQFDPVRNEEPPFPLGPMAVLASDFGTDEWTFAAGIYAPPAIGRLKYPDGGPQRYMLIEQDVMMVYYNLAAAWQPRQNFGVGLALAWVDVPKLAFEMVVDGNVAPKQVNPEKSRFDIRTRVEGQDRVGFTGVAGLWYEPLKGLQLALAGQLLPIRVDSRSKLYLEPETLQVDEEIAITKDGVPNNDVTFSFTLPVKLRAGLRYVYTRGEQELWDVELDVHYDFWSMMDSFVMDAGITTELMGQALTIDKVVIPKNFRDTVSVRLGGDVAVVPGWLSLRAGFFYESPAVRDGYVFLDSLSFHRFGPSGGLTLHLPHVDLSLAYTWLAQNVLVVTEEESRIYQQMPGSPCEAPYTDPALCSEHYLGQPAAAANAGTYIANYHLFNASLAVNF
jgi:long-chain fatty acid transport protein